MNTIISDDKLYRYTLWRITNGSSRYVNFICLNPSTADATQDDPTVRSCRRLSRAWGYDTFCITNLFAYRATDPRKMKSTHHPIGPENDKYLTQVAREADIIIAAWGKHGQFMARDEEVIKLIDHLQCLGINKDGTPKHPLYLPTNVIRLAYGPSEVE